MDVIVAWAIIQSDLVQQSVWSGLVRFAPLAVLQRSEKNIEFGDQFIEFFFGHYTRGMAVQKIPSDLLCFFFRGDWRIDVRVGECPLEQSDKVLRNFGCFGK